ncbi:hypothetical protein CLHOM_15930 [Clostridium homopropionicum DSM 5847]|uniref:Uncharacterized protein n=1 Tax=Clostridium homopropionicum DSM 5847 TaxID=1121318 RepID=A0A0L6ZB39_9CLOT|nr:hypothetical protein [Clostridium homopropionicum]KOA20028.1 hypothetical protein CLHOM_15930 [Clostridium homopropionicum DSM 5847]SFG65157.1 hypothetical protein SAMN04488501_11268 [Clostridium homopropionicum]
MKKKLMSFFFMLALLLGFSLMKSGNVTIASAYESAWYPIPSMNITQIAYESYSHSNSNHIDAVGGTYAFAPFTGKVVNVSLSYGVCLFQSTDKVYYPDGTLDYMTVQFMHGSNYSTWKSYMDNGTVIAQGTDFYKIGGTGSGGAQVYANHFDIGVYKGKTSSFTTYFSKFGNTYSFNAFYINPNKTTSIVNKGKVAPGNTVYNNAPTDYSGLWSTLGSQSHISVTYQTYDDVNNAWLSNVTDTQDYAGIFGHDVTGVYANLSSGNIYYKVHVKGGSWLPEVANRSDYAGILTSPIDGLMVKTDTRRTIHYRVHLRTTNTWLPYVTGYNTADSNNGYAGSFGNEIDAIQMYLD